MKTRILCNTEVLPADMRDRVSRDPAVHLSTDRRTGNVYFEPEILGRGLGRPLDSVSLDLGEIAAFVYLGDKAVPRGEADKWTRSLSFVVPVRNPGLWSSVRSTLMNVIGTLTGDNVEFHFVRRTDAAGRRRRDEPPAEPTQKADCVALFSGGLDSFAGIPYLARQGRRPLLASHYVSSLKGLQVELRDGLEESLGQPFEHWQYRVTSRRGAATSHPYKSRESSHRARSFLFLSYATIAAALHGLEDVFICENGVLSLNVPISDARKGSRSTRHAHPLYLLYFNELVDALYGRSFRVLNPFRFWTKGEEARLLGEHGLYPMIRKTVSCWGYPQLTIRHKDSNHCGSCLPCIVRRTALIAADLERYDDRYVVDVFDLGPGASEKDWRTIEDLLFFCESFATLSETELLYQHPELVMAEVGAEGEDGVGRIIRVYRRFAEEVLEIARRRCPGLLSAPVGAAAG